MIKKILIIAAAVLLAIAIAVGVIVASVMADIKGTSRDGALCTVVVPQGASVTDIATLLEEAGAVDNALVFRLYTKFKIENPNFKYGTYEFANNIGFEKIAEILSM